MGSISITRDGAITTDGAPPLRLPKVLNRRFVETLLRTSPDEENFIGELAQHLGKEDKSRLRNWCRDLGDEIWRLYCTVASKWAAVINTDNKWNMADFQVVYSAVVNSSWAQEVIVTTTDFRFVRTPRGLYTFPEFHWIYNVRISDHLDDFVREQAAHLVEVKCHISSELVRRRVCIADAKDAIDTIEVVGLATIPTDQWILPKGVRFLSEEPVEY